MPLEGKINSFSISYETVLSDIHPAVTQSLIMDEAVTAKVPAGTLLKKLLLNRKRTKTEQKCKQAKIQAQPMQSVQNPTALPQSCWKTMIPPKEEIMPCAFCTAP